MSHRLRNLIVIALTVFSLIDSAAIGPLAAQEAQTTIYVVQPGDTLPSIARRYGLGAADLAKANGLINPNLIYVGQSLVIPTTASAANSARTPAAHRLYIVRPDDTLFTLALKYGVTPQSLINTNQLNRVGLLVAGQELIIPADAASNQAAVAQPG